MDLILHAIASFTGFSQATVMTFLSFTLLVFGLYFLPSHSAKGFSLMDRWRRKPLENVLKIEENKKLAAKTDGTTTTTKNLQWWDDLAPPFSMRDDENTITKEPEEEQPLDISELSNTSRERTVTHFCFLVHGHRGFARDLSYLQTKMERVAAAAQKEQRRKYAERKEGTKDKQGPSNNTEIGSDFVRHDLVVHAVSCNEKRTDDGVVNGGERLVAEMLSVIREEMRKREAQWLEDIKLLEQDSSNDNVAMAPLNITISMLGNSLGGIYSRYAIAKLKNYCDVRNDTESSTLILDGRYNIHFNVFCTTATPHLGIAGHTFLPLPRTAEIGVAHALGDTGKDLFRLNDLMKRMATSPEFLQSLGCFRKRIAYANAYATDFAVPVRTAAFLSESSKYPHHFVEDSPEEDRLVVDDNGLVIATLHTPPNHKDDIDDQCYVDDDENTELVEMSRSLDSLGWKKVFVDVRKEIPKLTLPTALLRRSNSNNSTNETSASISDNGNEGETVEQQERVEPIHLLKQKGPVVSSRDVAAALTTPLFFEESFHWPMGHNMIVAFSRSRLSTYLNKAGRPVVDVLANELVHSIFSWAKPDNSPTG